ncbi:hypothetical protein HKK52_31150 [Pseudomonas sp. ADAK2]|uniref:hypothetical protein n=1 Tax=Pseudomonas TaxID=286 RepID=UPI00146365B0|nr:MULTISPECIES: hypothetical protein [unclassified Pseudomonas]QJI45230.1 hypothetical protein HKK53_31150 [Pseudomonas sp. ADAK7]QJI51531.1 hypothetical protein HKK52_31150 [Pseudomonas sp. ADAK2]
MANDSMFQGATPNTDPTRPMPGTDEPTLDSDAPAGMDPSRDPALSDEDRPEDWKDPAADEDVPAADEETPLSDDLR